MGIYVGDLIFTDNGGQLINALLYNKDSNPTVATEGKIYWNTVEKKAYIYSGTSWVQISLQQDQNYIPGVGITISDTNIIDVDIDPQGGLEFNTDNQLKIKADNTEFTLDGDGLSIKAAGIVGYEHIANLSIPDSKLQQITATNKVAASAVEDKFLRNDGDDVSSGGLQLGDTIQAPDLLLDPQTSAPTATQGRVYFDDNTDKILYYDGTTWQTILDSVGAGVQSNEVTGTNPLIISGTIALGGGLFAGATTFDMNEATTAQDGYLTSVDWNTFDGKQDVLTDGDGIDITGTTISVDIKNDNGLDFDTGELYVKLKSGGQILVDTNGLYWSGAYPIFQTVHDQTVIAQATSDITFKVDSSGSLSIENNAGPVTIWQVRDGDVNTSLVTMSNANVVGMLTVQGDETRLVSDEVNCGPLEIVMAIEQTGTPAVTDDGRFTINRGTDLPASVVWDEGVDKWGFDNGSGTIVFPTNKYATIYSAVGPFYIVTILAATHGLGSTDEMVVTVYDDSSPRKQILPKEVEVYANGDIDVTFETAQDGKMIIRG